MHRTQLARPFCDREKEEMLQTYDFYIMMFPKSTMKGEMK